MSDREDDIGRRAGLLNVIRLESLSQFFYQNATIFNAVLATVGFIAYLLLVMTSKATGFETEASSIRSLGTTFGFDQTDIIAFLSARTEEMIASYIIFNQVWDVLFGVIYGIMYMIWLSVIFKQFSHKLGRLNLVPVMQVAFDWLENYELAIVANQYLVEGSISPVNAQLASIFSMIKWGFSGMTYVLISLGLVLLVYRFIQKGRYPE